MSNLGIAILLWFTSVGLTILLTLIAFILSQQKRTNNRCLHDLSIAVAVAWIGTAALSFILILWLMNTSLIV